MVFDKFPRFLRGGGRVGSFALTLPGATWRDRFLACVGATFGLGVTGLICSLLLGDRQHLPLLFGPMGASALLIFAVPTSPMAQPWPIIGGNSISGAIGLAVGAFVHEPAFAAALAVGVSIAVMSFMRCLHPPGGAIALSSAIGGSAIGLQGLGSAVASIGFGATILTLNGLVFHKLLSRHGYPHVPMAPLPNLHGTTDPPPRSRVGFTEKDIEAALLDVGEAFDIDREDLARLLRQVERRALERTHGSLDCSDIMSRDVICIGPFDPPEKARHLLVAHNLRVLPVIGDDGAVLGVVGLRELLGSSVDVKGVMSKAVFAKPDQPALDLSKPLTDGRHHAVIVVDDDHHLLGVVTQTDLFVKLLQPRSP